MKRGLIIYFGLLMSLYGCSYAPSNISKSETTLEIYPEYRDVIIPCNIAPLNFLVRNEGVEAV